MFKKLVFCAVSVALIITPFNNLYATGRVLALNPDPVTSAMGDAGVALSTQFVTGTNINPAASIGIYRTVASLSTTNLTGDISHSVGGIGFLTTIGVFGASLMYVDYQINGDFYDNNRNKISMGDTNDIAFVLNYSLPLKRYLPTFIDKGGIGVNLKIIRSSLVDYVSEAFLVDAGAILSIPTVDNFSFGAAIKNLGTNQKFVAQDFKMPKTTTFGLGYHNENFYNLKVAFDFNDVQDYQDFTSIGFAVSPVYFLTFRTGLKFGGESLFNNFRIGVGLEFESVTFDYAFLPTSDLNATHQFNLSFAFGAFSDQKRAYEYYLNLHFREAEANFYAKDFVKARHQFDDILSVYPDHKPSQEYLRRTIAELEKIDEYNLDRANRYIRKANKALEKNDAVAADKYFRMALDIDPKNKIAIYGIEKAETATHDVKVLQARNENKERINYLWERYEKFYKKGDLVRARDSLKYLLDIDSENALANEKLVSLDNQLAKIASDKSNEIYDEGMKYYKDGNYEEAIKYFEAVVVAAPHRIDVQNLIEKAEKNIQEIAEYERLASLEKEQAKVKDTLVKTFNTALSYYEKGKLEQAVVSFNKAKDIADKYEFNEYYKNATTYISKISNNLSEKYYKRGFEAFRKNKFEEAAQSYKKSLEYNPGNTSASFELDRVSGQVAQKLYEQGMTAYSKNDMVTARECFRKALYYKPNKIEAQKALERIR